MSIRNIGLVIGALAVVAATAVGGGLVITPASYSVVLTATGNTALTLPTSGTLATQSTVPYGMVKLLGYKLGADFNTTADQAITITTGGSKWRPGTTPNAASGGGVIVTNCSATPTAAAGTVYTAASKGGLPFGTSADNYTGATGPGRTVQNAATTTMVTNTRTESTVYLSLTTANGSALTCDVYIVGMVFP